MLEVPVPCLSPGREEAGRAGPVTAAGNAEDEAWAEGGGWLALALEAPAGGDLEAAARQLYDRLLARVAASGAHLHRVWNHVPRINEGAGDGERYRRFNAGRARALRAAWGADGPSRAPAASAVGVGGDRLAVWALAGPEPGTRVENPLQVPAWTYPAEHGPEPPCFARALVLPAGGPALVSGTASVLGHRSVHAGDPAAQVQTTLDNLDAVRSALPGRYAPAALKAYLRRAADAEAVRGALASRRPGVPALLLRADICRSELAVEIEETCRPV